MVAVYNDPNRKPEFVAWRNQSPAHEMAAAQAEMNWEVLGHADDAPLSRSDTLKLAIQVHLARLSETWFRTLPTWGVAAALILALYLGLDSLTLSPPQPDTAQAPAEDRPIVSSEPYRTLRGQGRTVSLDDGSEIWMDWQTELVVSMTASDRRVELLRGRALFSVVPDPGRPFSVVSEGAVATALGTEFVVYRLDGQTVEVEVLEGAVGVQPVSGEATTRLGVADVVQVSNGEVSKVWNRPLAEIGSWRDGILVFEKRPLIEVLETLEPYTSYQIDARYILNSDRPVSGTFLLSKGDEALRILMQSYQLTGEVRGKNELDLRSVVPVRPL